MASKKPKLTSAQQNALGYLHRNGSKEFTANKGGSEVMPYQKLHQLGYANMEYFKHEHILGMFAHYTLTPAGRDLAATLFTSEPVAAQADSPAPDDSPVADSDIPFAGGFVEGEAVEPVKPQLKQHYDPVVFGMLVDMCDDIWNAGIVPVTTFTYCYGNGNLVSGHSRDRKPRKRALNAPKSRFKAHQVSTIMMQSRTRKYTGKMRKQAYRERMGKHIIPLPQVPKVWEVAA